LRAAPNCGASLGAAADVGAVIKASSQNRNLSLGLRVVCGGARQLNPPSLRPLLVKNLGGLA
jgi:hypothetical protein